MYLLNLNTIRDFKRLCNPYRTKSELRKQLYFPTSTIVIITVHGSATILSNKCTLSQNICMKYNPPKTVLRANVNRECGYNLEQYPKEIVEFYT